MFIDADPSSRTGRFRRSVCARCVVTLAAVAGMSMMGCGSHQAPQASITQIATFDRPAKSPACSMPVLHVEPLTRHHKIAIVEAWGDFGQEDAVMEALRRRGCETGADALLIVESQSQVDPATAKRGLPEDLQTEEFTADATQMSKYKKERRPGVGESGHPGLYIDSVAIVYEKEKGDRAAGN